MMQWLGRLAPRERILVLTGVPLLLLLLAYSTLWRPFEKHVDRLQQMVAEQLELEQWMKNAAREVKQLRGQGSVGGAGPQLSLLTLADRTARQNKLRDSFKRVEPEGQNKVRIRMEQVGFDDLMRWLELLRDRHGVTVETITLDRQNTAGTVNVRLTLMGPAS